MAQLQAGEPVEVIFDVDTLELDVEAFAMAQAAGRTSLGPDELAYRSAGLANLKQAALADLEDVTVLATWEHLSTGLLLVETEQALQALLARPAVLRLHANETRYELFASESLPLIGQDDVAAQAASNPELLGEGSVVAVLDSGVDYLDSFFGCTAPGTPASCPVADVRESAPNDGMLDDSGHGTSVSAIVHLTAPNARLIVADIIGPNLISNAMDALNWVLGKKQGGLNVVAINMSFGVQSDIGPQFPWFETQQECEASKLRSVLGQVMAAGIQPIAATGNEGRGGMAGTFRDGVADPACVAGVVSVGAVYDEDLGMPFDTGRCVDMTANEDQVTCFSQTATFLSLLAPGAVIEAPPAAAAPHTIGTSFAAPHVAGARIRTQIRSTATPTRTATGTSATAI